MYSLTKSVRLILLLFLIDKCFGEIPHRRFEYKFSFKPPYLAQRDGSVPFWKYGGNAIASADNIRLAPSLKSQKGAIWTKAPINFEWWEADITFRITGRGRIGADGMAFWYVAQPGDYEGTVFGSSDQWNGLGIFFDSFDNDNKHNNPYIMAVLNDGSKVFDHSNDGANQMIAGCLRDFRNKPFSTRARIEYYRNTLTVLFHNGNTQNENDFEVCLRVENVFLPKNGYFGVSAATGGLADDHDVKQFLTHSLYPPGSVAPQVPGMEPPKPEDQQKLTAEYAEYQRKLEIQKEQYKKDHPEVQQKEADSDFDEWFETDSQRELRQVFSVQSQMYEAIRVLSNKLDEVIGRQERTLSMLSSVHSGVGGAIPPGQVPPVQPVAGGGVQRHEIDSILSSQKELYNSVIEIRNFVVEVHRKTESVLNNQIKQPTAQVQSIGYDSSAHIRELLDGFSAVRRDISFATQKVNNMQAASCPNIPCLTTTTFIIFAIVQVLILVGYFFYRYNKENQAKKFY
ncbi:protein ERGIC-53 [Planococcus citri]|uniref:protein ERGIC-53 n=1 Tax=Planococcus citri TaxID=170843 RepID=UPI0031F8482E